MERVRGGPSESDDLTRRPPLLPAVRRVPGGARDRGEYHRRQHAKVHGLPPRSAGASPPCTSGGTQPARGDPDRRAPAARHQDGARDGHVPRVHDIREVARAPPLSVRRRFRLPCRQEDAHDAHAHQDPDLTQDALDRHRQDREAAARTAYAQAVCPIREDYDRATHLNAKALAEFPTPTGSTADVWRSVEIRLDAGATLDQIVATADVPTLQSIREWAPTWLAVNGGDPAAAPTLGDRLDRATLSRYAAITEDADMAVALDEAPALAGLAVTLAAAEAEAQGVSGAGAGALEAAVATAMAEREAARGDVDSSSNL